MIAHLAMHPAETPTIYRTEGGTSVLRLGDGGVTADVYIPREHTIAWLRQAASRMLAEAAELEAGADRLLAAMKAEAPR